MVYQKREELEAELHMSTRENCLQSPMLKKDTSWATISSTLGLWPGPIWAGYRLNGSLKTGFTTNRFHSVSGYLENGPNRFETGQIFPKRAEKNPGKNGIFTSL